MPQSALNPPLSLLVKLGSVAVHAEEMLSPHSHPLDRIALESALKDAEVQTWIAEMNGLAMLPVKRN